MKMTTTGGAVLLAKSRQPNRPPITLDQHTGDVMASAVALFGTPKEPSPLASDWGTFFSLRPGDVESFVAHLQLAAFCHDWGKANDGFQRMLSKTGEQLLRHEQISAILMCCPKVWDWLIASKLDVAVVLSAVLGHHLKCRDIDLGRPESEADQPLRLRWDDPTFRGELAARAPSAGLTSTVPTEVPKVCAFGGGPGRADLDDLLEEVRARLDELADDLDRDGSRQQMLWAVRAALVAADSAGSGLPRTGKPFTWAADCFRFTGPGKSADWRMTGDTIRQLVIGPKMARRKLTDDGLHPFQIKCGDPTQVGSRALVLAPCGSGKTLAAWRWIAAQLDQQSRGRAIFLYPTRGTATEGYQDYAGLAGEGIAALVHGTADLDLDRVAGSGSADRRIAEARLFALRQWPKRLFTATVDQFLGFMQHAYAPTCQLPLLADAVVVLDEIHSYDRGMWSALTEFLRVFHKVPVLCMTATLLEPRVKELTDPNGINLQEVRGLDLDGGEGGESTLALASRYKRYKVRRVANATEARQEAEAALDRGDRVLWVVNTVDRCQAIARQFAADPAARRLKRTTGVPVFCYHSRYKLHDRGWTHRRVVRWFKKRTGRPKRPVLAVTTQVCEMSLDLDADLLITEECPATALVQRMGRCCRETLAHVHNRVGDVRVYKVDSPLPYTKRDMDGVDRFVGAMTADGGLVSQERLEELLVDVTPPVELPKACRFTQSGVWAAAGEEQFRDTDDLSRPAVLDKDVDEYIRLRDPKTRGTDPPWKADGLVMQLPKKFTQDQPGLPQWLKMAHSGTYRPALGFCENDLPDAWLR